MQVVNLWYDNFLWRLWIWRVYEWTLKPNTQVKIIDQEGKIRTWRINKIFSTLWLQRIEQEEAKCW
jgi:GTP-binding protein